MALDLLVIVPLMLGIGYVFHLLFEKPLMTPGGVINGGLYFRCVRLRAMRRDLLKPRLLWMFV